MVLLYEKKKNLHSCYLFTYTYIHTYIQVVLKILNNLAESIAAMNKHGYQCCPPPFSLYFLSFSWSCNSVSTVS